VLSTTKVEVQLMSAMEGEIGGGESQIRSGCDGEELSSEMAAFVGLLSFVGSCWLLPKLLRLYKDAVRDNRGWGRIPGTCG
jgi:hypothetical protein